MDRGDSGNLVLVTSGVVELVVLFGFWVSTIESLVVAAFLLVVPPFVVGYLVGERGLVYGLILGVLPAIYALAMLPTAFLGLPPVAGALVLFVAYVLVSGLSGFGGR